MATQIKKRGSNHKKIHRESEYWKRSESNKNIKNRGSDPNKKQRVNTQKSARRQKIRESEHKLKQRAKTQTEYIQKLESR